MRSRTRILAFAGLASLLVAAKAVAPVWAAGAPQAVSITSPMHFNEGEFNTGTFSADGPAADRGLICESGEVVDTRLIFAGWQSGRGAQIPVRKTFSCPDGDLFIKIQVHLDFASSTETFSWVVLGGTGAYGSVRGGGSGTTTSDGSDPQTGNINTYTGFLLR
jgi:hypothetical protein